MKRLLFFILVITCPLFTTAQYFTPNEPEGRGIYLFENAAIYGSSSKDRGWLILHNEQVRVDSLQDNGWCYVYYKSTKTDKEFKGYLRMKSLIPLDEKAEALKVSYEKRALLEKRVLTWGIILAIIGLVVSLLSSLGRVSTILSAVVVILLSALEIYFFTHADGFNFYSPNVVGWKWSIIWSLCFLVFFLAQIFLWVNVLSAIGGKLEVIKTSAILALLAVFVLFVASLVTMGSVQAYMFKIFIAIQGLIVAYLFIQIWIKQGFVEAIMITPFYAIGLTAICYMGYDIFVFAIVATVALAILGTLFSVVASGGFLQRAVGQKDGKTVWKWGDEK